MICRRIDVNEIRMLKAYVNNERRSGHSELKLMSRAAAAISQLMIYINMLHIKNTTSADGEIQPQHLTLTNTLCPRDWWSLCVCLFVCAHVCVGDLLVSVLACVVSPLQTAATAAAVHCAACRSAAGGRQTCLLTGLAG